MVQMQRHKRIAQYFQMWITRDFSALDCLFSPQSTYEECYGPIYSNLPEIHRWIVHQVTVQKVTQWPIHKFIDTDDTVVVTWTFAATEEKAYMFDVVSIIHFDAQNRIDRVREFEAKHTRDYPYRKQNIPSQ